jgi:Spy/CpxP family protein refolding chaperone
MRKSLLALTAVGILTLSGVAAQNGVNDGMVGQGHKNMTIKDRSDKVRIDNDMMAHHDKMSFFDKLDLSDGQKQQINTYKDEMSVQMKAVFDNISETKGYFRENTFDKGAFLKDKKELSNTMIEIRANYLEKAYSVLTDEQKGKISEVFDKKTKKIRKNIEK